MLLFWLRAALMLAFLIGDSLTLQAQNCPEAPAPRANDMAAYYQIVPGPHHIQVLNEGVSALQARLDVIARAQCYISVEYIIYYNDQAGRLISQALIRKKRKIPRIRIRILMDAPPLGWSALDRYTTTELLANGIEVGYYNPSFNLFNITHRNHRKLILTENEVIFGGRNIGNHYFDMAPAYGFADRDLWLKGPGLRAMSEVFELYWNSNRVESAKPVKAPKPQDFSRDYLTCTTPNTCYWPTTEGGQQDEAAFQNAWANDNRRRGFSLDFLTPSRRDSTLLRRINHIADSLLAIEPVFEVDTLSFISDHPDFKRKDGNITGASAYPFIQTAKDSVWVENGYFIPQGLEKKTLREMLDAGIQVKLLTNSRESTDEFIPNTLTQWTARTLLKDGLKVWLYKGKTPRAQMPDPENTPDAILNTHAKTIVVDDKDVWIGTMNFDPRSVLRLNSEMAVIVHNNTAFAQHVFSNIAYRLQSAHPMTLDLPDARERIKSVKQWFQVLFTHLGRMLAESQF